MLEGSTLLSAIAARTKTLTMGLLVSSVTYRNPALAAKITTTIDIVSKGRVWHGLADAIVAWQRPRMQNRSFGSSADLSSSCSIVAKGWHDPRRA